MLRQPSQINPLPLAISSSGRLTINTEVLCCTYLVVFLQLLSHRVYEGRYFCLSVFFFFSCITVVLNAAENMLGAQCMPAEGMNEAPGVSVCVRQSPNHSFGCLQMSLAAVAGGVPAFGTHLVSLHLLNDLSGPDSQILIHHPRDLLVPHLRSRIGPLDTP